jgi:hypothetical protein
LQPKRRHERELGARRVEGPLDALGRLAGHDGLPERLLWHRDLVAVRLEGAPERIDDRFASRRREGLTPLNGCKQHQP